MIWVNPIVLEMSSMTQGSTLFTGDEWKRPYQIFEHSENLLSKDTSEFERADVITNLRKSIDLRIRLIDKRYALRSIPIKNKPSDYIELLEFLGIIRPKMLKKLIEIRNIIEHEDAKPPSKDECEVFLEFTWYFLRSTDSITQRVVSDVFFEDKDEVKYWAEVSLEPPNNLMLQMRGWFSGDLVSDKHIDDWITLYPTIIDTAKERIEKLNKEGSDIDSLSYFGSERNDNDIYLLGEIRGSEEIFKTFYKLYFNLV